MTNYLLPESAERAGNQNLVPEHLLAMKVDLDDKMFNPFISMVENRKVTERPPKEKSPQELSSFEWVTCDCTKRMMRLGNLFSRFRAV